MDSINKINIAQVIRPSNYKEPNISTNIMYRNGKLSPLVNIQIEAIDLSNNEEIENIISSLRGLGAFIQVLK